MAYAILRFSKRKAGGVAGADRHNERKKQSYKSNPDIVTGRSRLNYHFVKPGGNYKEGYSRLVEQAGCRVRKDSVVLVETLLTASPEFLSAMNGKQQRAFFERAFRFIADKVGEQNIISAVVHMDEKTPHMHLSFCPITEDNRLSAKEIIGDRRKLERWQDEYHAHMVKQYPELQRGVPSRISHRKHIPPYLFKQAKELDKAHGEIVRAIKDIGMLNAGKKRDEALGVLEKYIPVMTRFTAQIQRTDKYIADLEKTTEQMRSALDMKNEKISDMHAQIFGLEYNIKALSREQKRAKELLDRVPPEVLERLKPTRRNRDLER